MKNKAQKSIAVLFATAILTTGSVLMMIPLIMILFPVMAIVAGIIFAFRRSSLSLVCFGYPLTLGILSALIGCAESSGYHLTPAFNVSITIGIVGVGLIVAGLWHALPVVPAGSGQAGRPQAGNDGVNP